MEAAQCHRCPKYGHDLWYWNVHGTSSVPTVKVIKPAITMGASRGSHTSRSGRRGRWNQQCSSSTVLDSIRIQRTTQRSFLVTASGSGIAMQQEVTGQDLFTQPEHFAFAREMKAQLRTCRNKAEQFLALGKLTIKYNYEDKMLLRLSFKLSLSLFFSTRRPATTSSKMTFGELSRTPVEKGLKCWVFNQNLAWYFN